MYIVNQKLVFKYLMSSIAIGLTLPDVINLKFYLSLILIFFCQSQCMTTNTVLDNIKASHQKDSDHSNFYHMGNTFLQVF